MRRILVLIVVAAVAHACSAAASPPAPSGRSAAPSAEPPDSDPSASSATTVVEREGLKLVAAFDRLDVEAGGTVSIALSIENTRSTDVLVSEPCGPETMVVELRTPLEPIGQPWDGIGSEFKTYALEESAGSPMESSIRTPIRTSATAPACVFVDGTPLSIRAGATYEVDLTWAAEIVREIPALPGDAPFTTRVLYDVEPAGNGLIKAESLETSGTIKVMDGPPTAISAGLALDAAIADPAFATWLAEQPRSTWVNTNLFLQPAAIGVDVLPSVPYWDVELFVEPRGFAILYIDALNGDVLRRNFCTVPCDR